VSAVKIDCGGLAPKSLLFAHMVRRYVRFYEFLCDKFNLHLDSRLYGEMKILKKKFVIMIISSLFAHLNSAMYYELCQW